MVHLSPPFDPPVLKGIKVYPNDPFRFDFLLDKGDDGVIASEAKQSLTDGQNDELKSEAQRLIKYFLASLTIPEKDLWVNLSPYEQQRVIPESFGMTEMGRDILAQDYLLKQITASMMYPEERIGQEFWKRVYKEAAEKFGTTNIPVNTFNKVWIVPEKAVVYENAGAGTAYVVESKLKVMLEQDYLAISKALPTKGDTSMLASQIIREIVLPQLQTEVNEGKSFAVLRQVYSSLILAAWYKNKIKQSILAKVYVDKNKVQGLSFSNVSVGNPEAIYKQYLQAFKKGVYNYIKEEPDPVSQEMIPRKYFSGGVVLSMAMVSQNDKTSMGTSSSIMRIVKSVTAGTLKYASLMLITAGIALASTDVTQTHAEVLDPLAGEVSKGLVITDQINEAVNRILQPLVSGLENAIKNQDVLGKDIDPGNMRHNTKLFKELLKVVRDGLQKGGDTETFVRIHLISRKLDVDGDPRVQELLKILDGLNRIEILGQEYDPEKPVILFIHGAGFGPFPTFNKVFERFEDNYNVVFFNYNAFLGPENNSQRLISEWKSFRERYEIQGPFGLVDHSYGHTILNLAVKMAPDIFEGASLVEFDPIPGGSRNGAWGSVPVVPIGPFRYVRVSLVSMGVKVLAPSYRDFIKATDPYSSLQRMLAKTGKLNSVIRDPDRIIFLATGKGDSHHPRVPVWGIHRPGFYKSYKEFLRKHNGIIRYTEVPHSLVPSDTGVIEEAFRFFNDRVFIKFVPKTKTKNETSKAKDEPLGGIDLTPERMTLQVRNEGGEVKFQLDPVMLQRLQNAPGFMPVVIKIEPLKDLPLFLGQNSSDNVNQTL